MDLSDKINSLLFYIFESVSLLFFVVIPDYLIYLMCKDTFHLEQRITLLILTITTLIIIWLLISILISFSEEGVKISDRS